MNIPFFFAPGITEEDKNYTLDDASSKHCVQVLRKQAGDIIMLTDGKGKLYKSLMETANKKHSIVRIIETKRVPAPSPRLGIGISFTKNSSRIEWFIEKATEVGISDIYPLQCRRTERTRYNIVRLQNILIAAMLQSEQAYLPELHEQISFEKLIYNNEYAQKFIAHCENDDKYFLGKELRGNKDTLILIGPEGDFTSEEIRLAKEQEFIPVSLGKNRLRTETAGVVACALMRAENEK